MNFLAVLVILTTIHAECHRTPLDGLGDTIQVPAILESYTFEKQGDSDIHLNLQDPQDSNSEMTAEIMPGTAMWTAFRIQYPLVRSGKNFRPQLITVTGLRYYDHEPGEHWGARYKKFYIEIHPVTAFEVETSSG